MTSVPWPRRATPMARRWRPRRDDAQRCRAWLGLAGVKRMTDDLDGAFADLDRAEASPPALGLECRARTHPFPARQSVFPARQFGVVSGSTGKAWPGAKARVGRARGGRTWRPGRCRVRARADADRTPVFEPASDLSEARLRPDRGDEPAHGGVDALLRRRASRGHADALAAGAAAERVGHTRRHHRLHIVFRRDGRSERRRPRHVDGARPEPSAGRPPVRGGGAVVLCELLQAEGRQTEAARQLRQALEISRETGMAFHGAGSSAPSPAHRGPGGAQAALAEGEACSRPARSATTTSGSIRTRSRPPRAARLGRGGALCQALVDYTRPEPLPWTELSSRAGGRSRPWPAIRIRQMGFSTFIRYACALENRLARGAAWTRRGAAPMPPRMIESARCGRCILTVCIRMDDI